MFLILVTLVAAAAAEQCNNICTYNWDPVCGTDGQTYGNTCELESLSCLRRSGVKAAYQGECCPIACTLDWNPVCGSDGVTYGNNCELTSLACQRRSGVVKAFDGMCQDTNAECPIACTMDWNPVCGSDGVTYGNNCELTSQACLKKSGVTKSFDGECQDQCSMLCTMDYTPVCGTDGVTYGNKCEMESLSCLRRKSVRIAKMGEC